MGVPTPWKSAKNFIVLIYSLTYCFIDCHDREGSQLGGPFRLCGPSGPCHNHSTPLLHPESSHQSSSITQSCPKSLSHVRLFATPWTAARQAFLSITNSWSLLKLMSIMSVMSSNHLIFCHPLLLPPSIFPSIRVFSNESVLGIMDNT